MQLIDCPHCGPREELEFHYGGEAHVPYPHAPHELDDAEWAHFIFTRSNTRGVYAERWMHQAGCRRWFNALRDTESYRFLAIYRPDEVAPNIPEVAHLSARQRTALQLRDAGLSTPESEDAQ